MRWNVGNAAADAAVLAKAAENGSRGSCTGKTRAGNQMGRAKAAESRSRRKCDGKKRTSEQVANGCPINETLPKTLDEMIANMASMCVIFLNFSRTNN